MKDASGQVLPLTVIFADRAVTRLLFSLWAALVLWERRLEEVGVQLNRARSGL